MITNNTLAEAISGLASCIRALNWNNRSCSAAALVEDFIAKALVASKAAEANAEQLKQIDELRKLAVDMREMGALALATAQSVQVTRASNLVAKHMPQQVSTFGGSSGEFGWTGLDSFGNRVTWKVEPVTSVAHSTVSQGAPALTMAMCALAEYSMQMRDDKLNQLTYALMLKLNTSDIKEWLDASVRRSAAGSSASEAP